LRGTSRRGIAVVVWVPDGASGRNEQKLGGDTVIVSCGESFEILGSQCLIDVRTSQTVMVSWSGRLRSVACFSSHSRIFY
jgi:hypothetical protein